MERAVRLRPDPPTRPAVFEAGHDGGECAGCGFEICAGDVLTWTEPVGGELVHLDCVEDVEREQAARDRRSRNQALRAQERMWGPDS